MSTDKHRAEYIPFRCSKEMKQKIGALAAEQRLTKSEVLRDIVEKGLAVTGSNLDDDYLYGLIKRAVEEVTRPSVDRLAAISAKATQISSAAFFMSIYAATRDGSEAEQAEVREAAESARSLGIQYLKLRDRDIDDFIKEGVKQISET